jgi:cytochrome P450
MAEPITTTFAGIMLPHSKTPPGPRGHFLLGSAPEMQRDAPAFLLELNRQYGDIVRMRFASWPTYVVYHPDDIKYILQTNHKNYNNKDFFVYKMLRPLFGMGLITNDGQSWLHQRRLIQPAFHRKRVTALGAQMTDLTVTMLKRWQHFEECNQPLDIAAEMYTLTLCIAGKTLFNIDFSDGASDFEKAFLRLNRLWAEYFYAPFPPIGVPIPRNRRLQAAIQILNGIVDDIINERRQQQIDKGDLLSMLLMARDEESGQGMSAQQVHDEVVTMLNAGHETVATALTWTLYLLSQHPEVERRFHAELDAVLGGNLPTIEHLSRLSYTQMVFEEALRLYPSAWLIGRKAIAVDQIRGYRIPANSIIFLSPYCTHRHPAFWENPEVFDPERFTPERSTDRAPYAYFPFAGGPRQCIGNMYALMEAKLVLAAIGQRYRLRLVPNHPVEYEALLNIRPRHGMMMTLEPR